MKFVLTLLLSLFIICTASIFPASVPDSNISAGKADIAKVSSVRLQQKILLSDEQTSKVKEILTDYLKKDSYTNKNLTSIEDKIDKLLDQKQKAKFEIIKTEWLNYFLKGVKKSPAK